MSIDATLNSSSVQRISKIGLVFIAFGIMMVGCVLNVDFLL